MITTSLPKVENMHMLVKDIRPQLYTCSYISMANTPYSPSPHAKYHSAFCPGQAAMQGCNGSTREARSNACTLAQAASTLREQLQQATCMDMDPAAQRQNPPATQAHAHLETRHYPGHQNVTSKLHKYTRCSWVFCNHCQPTKPYTWYLSTSHSNTATGHNTTSSAWLAAGSNLSICPVDQDATQLHGQVQLD